MNVIRAANETLILAHDKGMHKRAVVDYSLGYNHLNYMYNVMCDKQKEWSYGKLCRWLGWIQAAVVAARCATLEDMKRINESCKQDADEEDEKADEIVGLTSTVLESSTER